MDDLKERLRGDKYTCRENMGCGTMEFCACATMEDAAARIEALEAELERRKYDGEHTCHERCQRPACVLRRENAALEAKVKEAGEALAFYAREQSWRSAGMYMCGHRPDCAAMIDEGNRARATLAKLQEPSYDGK